MGLLGPLRRLNKESRAEKLARFIERFDPQAARLFRDVKSDAGVYLFEQANRKGRVSDLLREADEIEADIERQGFWQDEYEWRIFTFGAERIERSNQGYRVETTCHGEFTAGVDSLPVALEACRVLARIQKDLFYAVGWSSNEPTDLHESAEPYLVRLSAESIQRFGPRLEEIASALHERGEWHGDGARIRPGTWRDWDETERSIYEVSVESAALSMSCHAPTLERATEFAGIYQSLQADIPRLLDWWN